MTTIKSSTKKKANGTSEKMPIEQFLIFLPVVLLLVILPNLIHMTVFYDISKTDAALFNAQYDSNNTLYLTDLFSQCKAGALVFFSVAMAVMAVLFCRYLFKNADRKTVIYLILSGVFLLMTFLSTLFADEQNSAWYGVYDRAEGFFTILCYFVIFLYTIYAFKKTDNYKYVICALFIVVVVNVIFGALQFVGADLMKFDWFKNLILPYEYRNKEVEFSFLNEAGKLYGTMYHYNYMGSFCAIILPIFSTHVFFEKKLISRIFFIVFDIAALFLLIGSTSRGGLIGVVIAVVVAIVIFARVILKNIKVVSIVGGAVAVIFVGLGIATNWAVFDRIPKMLSDVGTMFTDSSDFDYREKLEIRDIVNTDEGVRLETAYGTLLMSYNPTTGSVSFVDGEGVPIDYDDNGGTFVFEDTALAPLSFNAQSTIGDPDSYDFITLILKDRNYFCFRVLNNGRITYVDYYLGESVDLAHPEVSPFFVGKELVGSMRGYIWGRTLPLLRDTLFTGFGPDNFVYEFPQNDYLGKYYSYGTPIQTVDKPHNLYIQIFASEGLIALLAFLAMMLFYVIDSLRLYALRKEYNKGQVMGIAVLLGIIGYLGAGFFNDSIISVAPVFWIVLGIGVALNGINRLSEHPELVVGKRSRLKAERLEAEKTAKKASLDAEYKEEARTLIQKMNENAEREKEQRAEEAAKRDAERRERIKKRGTIHLDDVMKYVGNAEEVKKADEEMRLKQQADTSAEKASAEKASAEKAISQTDSETEPENKN